MPVHLRWAGLGVFLALAACSVDATVYEASGSRSEGATAGGFADRPAVFGCNVDIGGGGAPAIVQSIASSASEASQWIRPGRSCREDLDCRSALLTPACDVEAGLCTACPEVPERIAYLAALGECLTNAIAECCVSPAAEQDCVFRRCQSACGPQ